MFNGLPRWSLPKFLFNFENFHGMIYHAAPQTAAQHVFHPSQYKIINLRYLLTAPPIPVLDFKATLKAHSFTVTVSWWDCSVLATKKLNFCTFDTLEHRFCVSCSHSFECCSRQFQSPFQSKISSQFSYAFMAAVRGWWNTANWKGKLYEHCLNY